MGRGRFVLLVGICVTLLVAMIAPASAAPATREIDNHDRGSVIAAFQSWLEPTQTVATGWTGSTESCQAGTITAADRTATLSAVNYVRSMAALPPVRLYTAFSRRAQAAALIMAANQSLTHYPPKSADCYTTLGNDGARHGLLYLGWGASDGLEQSTGPRAVVGYMTDGGEGNQIVGHRRWLLYPQLTHIGTGDTNISNSLYVLDRYHEPSGSAWISWPTPGYFPRELEPDGRWSLSRAGADFSRAKVRVLSPTGSVFVTKAPVHTGYADNAVSWDMALPDDFAADEAADYPVVVTVSGIRLADGSVARRSWRTILVRASSAPLGGS